jgi:glycosyltransferase involved in cell wall biosynthesis
MTYVLITPAHNEEDFIEKTIQSVLSQTVLPKKWVIVSDGSTDGTDAIIRRYAKKHNWIEFVRRPEHADRQFAAKVHAFNEGYKKMKNMEYAIIGNLDADISFEKDYFEFLLSKFIHNPKLGVAGTPFVEESFKGYDFRFANIEHVSGACQLFRRECFESVGGYQPVRGGGIDWIAVTTARMKGWQTRTFTEKTCTHHREIGTGNRNPLLVKFDYGKKAYYLGGHPLWEIFRSLYQMKQKPYIIGGVLLFAGYTWGFLSRMKRPVSPELLEFYQHEQMMRLKEISNKLIKRGKP